ncbi:hypothetical protein AAULR_04596, partial [Lacticaseibacillus rhamnosus MTCC 5462]
VQVEASEMADENQRQRMMRVSSKIMKLTFWCFVPVVEPVAS